MWYDIDTLGQPERRKRGKRTSPAEIKQIYRLLRQGETHAEIARKVGVSRPTVIQYSKKLKESIVLGEKWDLQGQKNTLSKEARECLKDFRAFFLRYVGPNLENWDGKLDQVHADLLDAITAPSHTPWTLINIHPQIGKTTIMLAWIVWQIVQDRDVVIAYYTAASDQAQA